MLILSYPVPVYSTIPDQVLHILEKQFCFKGKKYYSSFNYLLIKGFKEMHTRDPQTAKIGDEILPFEVGYLPEFFKRKGEEELKYTPSVRKQSLLEIKDAVARDKALKSLDLTDEALLVFLNSKKYDLQKTLLQLHKYHKFKSSNPEWFRSVTFEKLAPLMECFTILPWRCQDGCALLLIRLGNFNSETHTVEMIHKTFITVLIQGLRDPMTQVNGFKLIFDMNIDFRIMKICTPHNIYMVYSALERVLAARVKGYHIVNMRAGGRLVWQICSMLISEKVKKRVHIHASIDELLNFFPKAILPVEYGGDLEGYDWTDCLRKMTSPEEFSALNMLSN